MTNYCTGNKWNTLSSSAKSDRIMFNLLKEEDILNVSEARYYEQLDRDPLIMQPEQDLITNMILRTSDAMVEYVSSFRIKTFGWMSPIANLGPVKVTQVALESIIQTIYNSRRSDEIDGMSHYCNSIVSYQDVVRAIARDLVFIAKYQSARDSNRGAWVLANRAISGTWTKRNIQSFLKTHIHDDFRMSNTDRYKVGVHILNIFEKAGLIRSFTRREGPACTPKYLMFTDDVINALILGHRDSISRMHLRYVPMIVPPIAHTETLVGGAHTEYLRKSLVKDGVTYYKDEEFMTTYRSSIPSPSVLKALNKLMSTEWAVNTRVLDVMQQLFESNSRCCNLPPYERDPILFDDVFETTDKNEIQLRKNDKHLAYDEWYKSVNNRMRIADLIRTARDLDAQGFFYHVWTCDFRGRMYTTTETLSPQSGDTDKGLLLFANAYKRTERAEYWLKIQIANLFGHDKVTRAKRIKWVDDNMEMLRAINDDPLGHIGAWEDDAPKKNSSFQRLANIFELFRTDGMLQIPIFIDGSCNGYQHWSAMMRDVDIARLVNLIKADVPGDIYQVVADIVTEEMIKDRDTNDHVRLFLDYWNGKIPRGVVKRAVMTDPYGVTPRGIEQGLIADKKLSWVGDQRQVFAAAEVMTDYIRLAMEKLLINPNRAKKWLKHVTKKFAEANLHATWVVPSGFTVMHEYHGTQSLRVKTEAPNTKDHNLVFNEYDRSLVNSFAACNGISPNFVHSLDASHMVAVVNRMDEAGCDDMAFVHDSYGAPATMIDTLMCVTQEEFVRIHKVNQLEILKEQWEEQLGFKLPDLPDTGDLDINCVLESEYFFH